MFASYSDEHSRTSQVSRSDSRTASGNLGSDESGWAIMSIEEALHNQYHEENRANATKLQEGPRQEPLTSCARFVVDQGYAMGKPRDCSRALVVPLYSCRRTIRGRSLLLHTSLTHGNFVIDQTTKSMLANAVNFHDLVKAHQPTFARMDRLCLLDTLTDSSRPQSGKITSSRPVDVEGHLSFSLFGEHGAFYGAHADALACIWVRNLDGRKSGMIVPDDKMKDELEASCPEDDSWLPQDKERLVILQQDDVLLMPPGLYQVHAVYSPETFLTSVGALWDKLNILAILESLLWIGQI